MIAPAELARDVVVLACSISAGIHGALTPAHLTEGAGLGAGFLAATVLLAGIAVLVTRRPQGTTAFVLAAGAFFGLLASYALATTVGLPLLHPDPEPVDRLALATKAIEVVALLAAAHILWRDRPKIALAVTRPKGMTT